MAGVGQQPNLSPSPLPSNPRSTPPPLTGRCLPPSA